MRLPPLSQFGDIVDTSLTKTVTLDSPNRTHPLQLNIELAPKSISPSPSGEHVLCDIALGMGEALATSERLSTALPQQRILSTSRIPRLDPSRRFVSSRPRPHPFFPQSQIPRAVLSRPKRIVGGPPPVPTLQQTRRKRR
ncbi:hypothetical protein NPIL_509931 [Nephila pilipes]|uniref:Uncharacterized protein n=1 Tax=Nephila pilipes TaxID=299642 RepID=A0A8X6NC63_NEPPI|nr:hypothetical protein NPIL_509931 [Nephila pilipes]